MNRMNDQQHNANFKNVNNEFIILSLKQVTSEDIKTVVLHFVHSPIHIISLSIIFCQPLSHFTSEISKDTDILFATRNRLTLS